MDNIITISIMITQQDVETLAGELEKTDSSPMTVLIVKLLKQIDCETAKLINVVKDVQEANPYSQWRLTPISSIKNGGYKK